jgi:hypothetical protein
MSTMLPLGPPIAFWYGFIPFIITETTHLVADLPVADMPETTPERLDHSQAMLFLRHAALFYEILWLIMMVKTLYFDRRQY